MAATPERSGAEQPITVDDDLYRRLMPNGHVAEDGKTVLLGAFLRKKQPSEKHAPPDPELSVDVARLTTPEDTQAGAGPGFGVGRLPARVPLGMGLTIQHRPVKGNYAHALVYGLKTRGQCQDLADATTVIIPTNPRPRAGP